MNKIYKKIWNRSRGCFVAVSEAMTAASQSSKAGVIIGTVAFLTAVGNNAGATDITVTQSQAVSGNYGQVVIGGNLGTKEVTIRTPNSIGYSSDSRQYQGSDPSKIDYSYDPHLRTPFSTGYYVNGRRVGENEFFNYWSNSAGGSSVNADLQSTISAGSSLVANNLTLSSNTASAVTKLTYLGIGYHMSGQGGDGGWTYAYAGTDTSDPQTKNGVSNLVNNGGSLIAGSINLCPGCNYIQNSGSSNIDDITGDGKVIINGGEVTTNGLLTLNPAKAANLSVKDLNTLASLNAISYAAGTKASLGAFRPMSDKIQIGNATLKIEGDYTQSIRDQASSAIKNKYGSGVNVQFTGNVATDNSLDLSNGWTSTVLNSVFDENRRADYLFHTLNWNGEGQDKVIGTGDISKNFGVKNVENVGSITVNRGATFAILGDKASTRLAGNEFIADHGTLIFGANGLASGGTATNVSIVNNGTLKVFAGEFSINNLNLDGLVNNSGTLRLNDFNMGNNGRLVSSGTLQADRSKLFSIEDSHIDGLNVVDLGRPQPQEVRQQLTEFFRKYVPENQKVLDEIANHASFTGGKVIVTNAHLTETQRDDLIKAFKDKFFLLGVQQETALPSASDEVLS